MGYRKGRWMTPEDSEDDAMDNADHETEEQNDEPEDESLSDFGHEPPFCRGVE